MHLPQCLEAFVGISQVHLTGGFCWMLSMLSSALGIKWGGLLAGWCSFCCGFCCPSSLTQELLSRLTPKCTQLSWHFPIGWRAKLFCVESIQQTPLGTGIAEKKNSKTQKKQTAKVTEIKEEKIRRPLMFKVVPSQVTKSLDSLTEKKGI